MYLSSTARYHFDVNEDEPVGFIIGTLAIRDRDEKQNKRPSFIVERSYQDIFDLEHNDNHDGVLILKKVAFTSSCPLYSIKLSFSW